MLIRVGELLSDIIMGQRRLERSKEPKNPKFIAFSNRSRLAKRLESTFQAEIRFVPIGFERFEFFSRIRRARDKIN